ncbi:hypothetical protein RN001_001826 [Aquatica leii]|uniref:THAP-type domain-containing protein n=1 Tax=Aquatica leii TaxID=1421715 RepID=A0AAN7SSQ3_9COLE|nr:hypothetical protein RN001_001826 [Aquatica leii]
MDKFLINKKKENHPSTITIEQPMSASYSEVDILQSKQPRCNSGPETTEIIEMDCISPEEDMQIPIEQQKTEKRRNMHINTDLNGSTVKNLKVGWKKVAVLFYISRYLIVLIRMGLCFVPDCDHTNKHGCKMFRFPLDSAIKKKWESLIRRADRTATKFSLVCSCHFVEGKKENCPTIFNRNKDKMFKYSSSEKRKRKNIQKEAVAQENTARFSTSPPTQAAKRANEEPSSKEINPTISKSLPILEAENYYLIYMLII